LAHIVTVKANHGDVRALRTASLVRDPGLSGGPGVDRRRWWDDLRACELWSRDAEWTACRADCARDIIVRDAGATMEV